MKGGISCKTCKFFLKTDNDSFCRRYPPTWKAEEDGYTLAEFVEVSSNDWCGEYCFMPPLCSSI
jgi:hypothetical protein